MAGVVDRDLGYHDFVRIMGDLGQPRVLVGILQDKGSEVVEGGDITLAGYAAVNEFGSDDGHVPERSFLRSTVDANQVEYQGALDEMAGAMVDATVSGGFDAGLAQLKRDLGQLGNFVAGDVKLMIRLLRDPPNAPSTLARKFPGTNPLIAGGRMRQSISFKVDMEGNL